jgi:DNA-directed RNA polymerase subunit beta'
MTDREIGNLSNGAIRDPQFIRAKDLEEKTGGLMDKKITGGLRGEKWSHIQLDEPIVNPIFEQPVRALLDMNKGTYTGLTEGRIFVDEAGNYNEEGNGITGGKAIQKLLSQVDKEEKLKEYTSAAKSARSPSALNKANHGIRYVEALKKFNLDPQEAYILNKVPVLPPVFRPIYALPDGNLHTSSVNYLYRDLGLANQKLQFMNSLDYMPESAKQELRKDIYKGTAAVQGLANPITFYPKSRPVRGIIEEIKGVQGAGSKTGFFQKHVLRREQDLVGRGTIIPEPKLGIDEAGIPEEMAWTIFRPFVIRELVNQGYKAVDADKEVDERSFMARKSLDVVMNDRPVLVNRAPSLHKFSIMALKPKIMAGRAVKIPPLIVKGFNADHDGDTMHVHVPVMQKAVTEAKRMLPSQHLFNPGTGNIMVSPSQEAAIGLYFLTKDGKDIKKSFSAVGPLKEALDKKEIDISDMVTLAGKKTSAGRAMVDAVLPEKYQGRNQVLDKKGVSSLLTEMAQNDPKDYAKTVHALAELGNEYSYSSGFTVGISDIQPDLPEKDALFAEARKKAKSLDDAGVIKLYSEVDKEAKKIIAKRLGEQGNNLYQMVRSGARGNMDQLKQIVSAPLLFEDVHGNPLPIPVESSFSKGLSMSEYWNSMYGARKGSVDAKLQTAKPGEFNKDLMATAVKNVIAEEDCGTDRGIDFNIDDIDAQDRVLTSDVQVGSSTVAKAGDIITSNMISKLRSGNVKKIKARSPLTCNLPKGTCAKCYGLDADGRFHAIGDNLGAIAGQSLTEPLTQMVLRSKHHGGVAGGQQLTGYEKIDKLVHMPKVIIGKATLAEKSGKISSIKDSPVGGKNVFVDDVKHFISPQNNLKVRLGSKLKKGDPLSDGIISPRDLVRLKGMESAQNYLVNEISNAYKDTGVNLKRKNIEAVIRSVADTTKVLDGGDSSWLYGDTVSYNAAEAFNRSALGKVPIAEAEGKPLFKDHGPVKAGTKVGKRVAKILEGLGYNDVSVGPDPIIHEPFLDGIKQLPMLNKDWMAQMGYGHLVRGIKEGAGQTWETDIHDYSPVPAFAYGAEFGLGEKGKY